MNKPTTPELIEILDNALEQRHSIRDVAKYLGISKQYLHWIIRTTPSLQKTKKIAKAKYLTIIQNIYES